MGYDPDFGTARKGPPSGPVDFLSLREIKESLGQGIGSLSGVTVEHAIIYTGETGRVWEGHTVSISI